MTRPHPVIGISSELPDRGWRCSHETNVPERFRHEHVIFISIKERADVCAVMCSVHRFLTDREDRLIHFLLTLSIAHSRSYIGQYFLGHILHPYNERSGKARTSKFIGSRLRPKAICQEIIFHSAVRLELSVSAMVIGEHQSPLRIRTDPIAQHRSEEHTSE